MLTAAGDFMVYLEKSNCKTCRFCDACFCDDNGAYDFVCLLCGCNISLDDYCPDYEPLTYEFHYSPADDDMDVPF